MPQLIAMVIVVVGAMIYMFQTFGGTGDKIEGIAQKSSIITEINNIKDGIKLAAKSEHIAATASGDAVSTLSGLGKLEYFAELINKQVVDNANATKYNPGSDDNIYYAISFGGGDPTNPGKMSIKLVPTQNETPKIFVNLSGFGTQSSFLEAQVTKDLGRIADINRVAQINASDVTKVIETGGSSEDGMFIIQFKDFANDEKVK